MKREWIWWTAAIILGLSLSVSGCGEKKSDGDTSQSRVGVAPSSPPEQSVPDDARPPSGGSEQSPSDTKTEQNTGSERKSQRG